MSEDIEVPPEEDFVEISEQIIQEKILHTLKIYPKISVSMLQVGIGTAISANMWKPVFDKMIELGKIEVETRTFRAPSGRDIRHRIVSLKTQ